MTIRVRSARFSAHPHCGQGKRRWTWPWDGASEMLTQLIRSQLPLGLSRPASHHPRGACETTKWLSNDMFAVTGQAR